MPYSRVSYTGDGSTVEYTIPFPFLTVSSVKVYVGITLQTYGSSYTVNTSTSKVTFTSAPSGTITIKRVTPRGTSERLVVFYNPSDLDAATLNQSDLQLLYIIQELVDDVAEGTGVGSAGGGTGPLPANVQTAINNLQSVLDSDVSDLEAAHDADVASLLADAATLLAQVNSQAADILAEHNAWVAAVLAETTSRNAAIVTASNVASTATSAVAANLTVLNAQVNDATSGLPNAHARVTSEASARASADSALSSRVGTLEASVPGIDSRLTTVEGVLSSGADVTALAFRVTTLETTVTSAQAAAIATVNARVATEEAARSTADTALGVRVTSVEASVTTALPGSISTVASAVTAEAAARASADTAIAANVTSVTATANGAASAVTTEATARATADGNLSGKYVLKVVSGNVVSGMKILSTTSPNAGDTSEIIFDATAFKVFNGTTGVAPFSVISGVVRVANLTITHSDVSGLGALAEQNSVDYSSDISGTKPPANADVTLDAINGGLTITSGGITLNGTPSIRSNGYSSGSSGWSIDGDGSAEFNNCTVRGNLSASVLDFGCTIGAVGPGGSALLNWQHSGGANWISDINDSDAAYRIYNTNGSYKVELGTGGNNLSSCYIWGPLWSYGISNISSETRKDNIRPIDYTLANLLSIQPKRFEWKAEAGPFLAGTSDIGVIAEEVALVFPELVSVGPDDVPGVNYQKFVPILLKAIHTLNDRITALEAA